MISRSKKKTLMIWWMRLTKLNKRRKNLKKREGKIRKLQIN